MNVPCPPSGCSTTAVLFGLQVEQLTHDEGYHKDILNLSLADRVKHMALHGAKYVAYFIDAVEAGDDRRVEAVLTDAFIITLATANALNQDLGKAVQPAAGQSADLQSLGRSLSTDLNSRSDGPFSFVKTYARAVGKLAKACESWDHMEDMPYAATMRASNLDLLKLVLAEAALRSIDLQALFRARLRSIESRSIFHSTLSGERG